LGRYGGTGIWMKREKSGAAVGLARFNLLFRGGRRPPRNKRISARIPNADLPQQYPSFPEAPGNNIDKGRSR